MENKDLEYYKNLGVFDEEQLEALEKCGAVNEKLDVIADPDLTVDEIYTLSQLMHLGASSDKVKDFLFYYRNSNFSEEQIGVIFAGFMQNIDVRSFANPLYTPAEMNNLSDLAYAEATKRLNGRTILKVYAKKQIMEFNKKNNTNLSLSEIDSIYSEDEWYEAIYNRFDDLTVYQAINEGIIDKDKEWCKKYYSQNSDEEVFDTVLNISVDKSNENDIKLFFSFAGDLSTNFGSPINEYELKQLYNKYLEQNKDKDKGRGR